MSRIVTFGEIMARLATPGFKRFQHSLGRLVLGNGNQLDLVRGFARAGGG